MKVQITYIRHLTTTYITERASKIIIPTTTKIKNIIPTTTTTTYITEEKIMLSVNRSATGSQPHAHCGGHCGCTLSERSHQ
jgi:hypothetical protein